MVAQPGGDQRGPGLLERQAADRVHDLDAYSRRDLHRERQLLGRVHPAAGIVDPCSWNQLRHYGLGQPARVADVLDGEQPASLRRPLVTATAAPFDRYRRVVLLAGHGNQTMLSALEAVNGALLFGISTAFLFAVMQAHWHLLAHRRETVE